MRSAACRVEFFINSANGTRRVQPSLLVPTSGPQVVHSRGRTSNHAIRRMSHHRANLSRHNSEGGIMEQGGRILWPADFREADKRP
jgi:hypothetical protein